jgi:hypothetical protein
VASLDAPSRPSVAVGGTPVGTQVISGRWAGAGPMMAAGQWGCVHQTHASNECDTGYEDWQPKAQAPHSLRVLSCCPALQSLC